MIEPTQEKKSAIKRSREERKNIRNEMSSLGRACEKILLIHSIGLAISFFFITSVLGIIIFILLLLLIIPLGFIDYISYKKATKKYEAKIKAQRLKYCIYCGGKLDSIQSFCPHCGKKFDETISFAPQTSEIEATLQEEFEKEGKLSLDQKEIYNRSRKSTYTTSLIIGIVFPLVMYLLIGFLANAFHMYPLFLILGITWIALTWPVGYFLNAIFIYTRFELNAEDIKIYIEKKVFFQVNWAEIDKIDIYKVRKHGHILNINYNRKFKLISLRFCEFTKKKQREIISALFHFSGELKDKISVMETSDMIVDEVGKKELYEEMYQFASKQRPTLNRHLG